MRVVFLSRLYWPHVGGVEKHVREVSTRLSSRGYKIRIITERYDLKLPEYEVERGIEIYRLPGGDKWQIWRWLWQNRRLLDWADIIHAHDVYFWLWPYRLLHPFKPTYITFHGWEGKYPVPIKNIWVRKISEWLAKGNICVGDYIAKWYGAKPTLVTYGAA